MIPQPSKHVRSIGAGSVIATTEMSATTVYCEKVDVPMKCNRSLPLHLNREVPSGITPFPCVARIFPQRLVFPDLQNLHSMHSGVLELSVNENWSTTCRLTIGQRHGRQAWHSWHPRQQILRYQHPRVPRQLGKHLLGLCRKVCMHLDQ